MVPSTESNPRQYSVWLRLPPWALQGIHLHAAEPDRVYTNCPSSLRGRIAAPNCDLASLVIGQSSSEDLGRPGLNADLTRGTDG